MLKRSFFMVFCVFLAGCSSVAPPSQYRPANYAGNAWQIAGSVNDLTGYTEIFIDGRVALSGRLSFFGGSGELSGGKHDGRDVTSSCHQDNNFWSSWTVCNVFVGNERAAILKL